MDSIPLSGLQTFLAIVQHGSLRAASQALNLKPPAVTQRLKALEAELGVVLFIRNTRSLVLTDAGRALRDRAADPMDSLAETVRSIKGTATEPKGKLRLSIPSRAFSRVVSPHLPAFQALYPDVELDISISERLVDIVSEEFHAGIRLGDHLQEDMIAVRLTPDLDGTIVASPDYLEAFGRPESPSDLMHHKCIQYRRRGEAGHPIWRFRIDDEIRAIDVRGTLTLDDFSAVVDAAKAGAGLGYSIRLGVAEDLRDGSLVTVLDDFTVTRPGFYLYFPRAHSTLRTLRLFVDFLKSKRPEIERTCRENSA